MDDIYLQWVDVILPNLYTLETLIDSSNMPMSSFMKGFYLTDDIIEMSRSIEHDGHEYDFSNKAKTLILDL
jgi:hypothetical protein